MSLYPLSFREFLMAVTGEQFAGLLDDQDYAMVTSFRQTYVDALKQYFYVGGMPEAVQSFVQEKDFNEVRRSRSVYWQPMSRIFPNMRR